MTGDYYSDNNYSDPTAGTAPAASQNWWEGPPPPNYTGAWPPPLQPGQQYGSTPGSVTGGTLNVTGQNGQPITSTIPENFTGTVPSTFSSPDALGHQYTYGAPTDTPAAPSAGAPGGGGAAPPSSGQGLTNPSYYAPFTGTQPGFVSPTLPSLPTPPPAFAAPSLSDAENAPGYQFGLQQGEQALQQSKAAQGLLRTGGTLKDILDYGRNAATQNYNNVYNQAANTYQTNYSSQYAPQLLQYQTQAANAQHVADATNTYNQNAYTTAANVFYNNQNSSVCEVSVTRAVGSVERLMRALFVDPNAAQAIDLIQAGNRARADALEKIAAAQARSTEIGGNAQANAAQQSGQAWAGAATQLGQIPQQIQRQQSRILQQKALSQQVIEGAQRLTDLKFSRCRFSTAWRPRRHHRRTAWTSPSLCHGIAQQG